MHVVIRLEAPLESLQRDQLSNCATDGELQYLKLQEEGRRFDACDSTANNELGNIEHRNLFIFDDGCVT